MAMPCGACGYANRDGARFCGTCGSPLARSCPKCETELPEGARFCDACGTPTETVAVEPTPPAAGVRKLVTVLFADLVGSTTLQERMDPEAVRAANERDYLAMRSAIEGQGGTVVKFVGDGMMAAFGVREMTEHDALRGLGAAMELRRVFGAAMRVGVNTGEVVVSPGDDDVLGDVVNVASRLEHEAPPGEILAGAETYRLTRGSARFGEPRQLLVKGRSAPVEARILIELTETAAPASVFVGRQRELAALIGALGTAAGTSRAGLATVIGSPGVGKSRLLDELAAAVEDEATVLVGRCAPGGASSLDPVVGIARGALAAAGGIDSLPVEASERTRIAAVLDMLVGAGSSGTPQEMFWAIRRVIELAAHQRPALVILDDLHWAEPVLLDLVEHLTEWLGSVAVLVVAAGRPELRELRPSLVEVGAGPASVLSLEGLDADATQQLAADLLGASGLPSDLAVRVVETTDGNPLFVRELLRMLVDDGVLRQDDEGWVLAVDAADIEVPSTINALLAARIERLPADERTLLERASVLGQEVVHGVLIELLPTPVRARAATLLESLRRKELLEPARTYWLDQPVLRFHHVLIRDSAYRRVLKAARAGLHERAARWFSERSGDSADHDELVGYHLEQALLSRRDLGMSDDHTQTVAADAGARLGRAARRALERDDLPAAAVLAGRALACLPEGHPGRAELLLVRCEALLDTGAVTSARDVVDELAVLGAGNERLGAWSVAYAVQLGVLSGTASLVGAEGAALGAANDLEAVGDPTGAAKAHRVRASVLARLGRIADTESALDQALTAAREAGDRRQISGVLAAAPPAALWGPSSVARAGGRCLDVVRLLRITTGAREVEAISIRCQAVLEALRGRRDAALTMLTRARGVVEELGLGRGVLDLELAAGLIDLVGGEAASADHHLEIAHDGYRATGLDADAAQAAALRARSLLLLGDDAAALRLADSAAAVAGSDLKTAVTWRAVTADVLARRGESDRALALAREAVTLTEATDALLDHAEALGSLAIALDVGGDPTGANHARERAAALYEKKGATALLERLRPPISEPRNNLPSASPNRAARCFAREQEFLAHAAPDEFRDRLHPEFVYEDRRPGPWERVMDRDRVVESIEVARAMQTPLLRYQVVATRGEELVLIHQVYGRDGIENEFLALAQYDRSDRCIRSILFEAEDLESALAEMDRLAAEQDPVRLAREEPAAPNRAVTVNEANLALMAAGRWDELRASAHPGFVMEDRRSVPTEPVLSSERAVTRAMASQDLAMRLRRNEVVATRGEVLALMRQSFVDGTFESDWLALLQIDDAGRTVRYMQFDADDTRTALAELDRLAELVEGNLATRSFGAMNQAIVTEDWDGVRSMCASGYVCQQRRGGVSLSFDTDQVIAACSNGAAPGSIEIEPMALGGDRIALVRARLQSADFVSTPTFVIEVDSGGRLTRAFGFDDDPLEARRVFERLVSFGDHPAVRAFRAVNDAMIQCDGDTTRAVLAPGFVCEERRNDTTVVLGTEDIVAEVGTEYRAAGIEVLPLEVRGERHALMRADYMVADTDFVATQLHVIEIDSLGRITRAFNFGEDGLDDARTTLERVAAERANAAVQWAERWFGSTDMMGYRAACNPEFIGEDCRPLMQGRYDLDAHIAAVGPWQESLRWVRPVQVIGHQAALIDVAWGNDDAELTFLVALAVDGEGRKVRELYFDHDAEKEAAASLRDIATPTDNLATLAHRAFMDAMVREDWVGCRAVLAPDFVHRTHYGGAELTSDVDQMLASLESGADGVAFASCDVIETLGERAALVRSRTRSRDSDFANTVLHVVRVDPVGRLSGAVSFNEDEIDRALVELHRPGPTTRALATD